MPPKVLRSPRARADLIEIWQFIAADNVPAADGMLDRFEQVLSTLCQNPLIGRARPELARDIRSFPVGSYVLFYQPRPDGILLVRVLNGYLDITAEHVQVGAPKPSGNAP